MNPFLIYPSFEYCDTTGYYDDSPYNTKKIEGIDKEILEKNEFWGKPRLFNVTIWLYIITDNMIHLICNYIAITYLQ